MEKLISSRRYLTDHIARGLFEAFDSKEGELALTESIFYYDFPSFRDYDDDSYRPNALILSPRHGIIAFNFCDAESAKKGGGSTIIAADENLSQFFSILFGRLIKSRLLRRTRNELAFQFSAMIYSPGLGNQLQGELTDRIENPICNSFEMLSTWMEQNQIP